MCGALLIRLRIFQGLSHKDKDQDLTYKDKDKDLTLVLEESLRARTRTRIDITDSCCTAVPTAQPEDVQYSTIQVPR